MRFHRFLLAGFVLLLDQATKAVIVARFSGYTVVPVIPGFFRLVRVENTGMAFGLFSDSSSPLAFWLLTLVAFLLWKDSTSSSLGGLALAVILGGAAGNVVDRLARGKVIDFLDFYIGRHHWPAFNLADSAIVIGAVLLLLDLARARTLHPSRPSTGSGP
ncbi:MAG: signal peptidase II [Acidobacteria bacterium RIFCSPLOWO2_02_FULL_61_28]|nr:MAG: signal peptidase II [Acidobacteria bacterium RIFCSPLOWO2_02_FULL_61_28]